MLDDPFPAHLPPPPAALERGRNQDPRGKIMSHGTLAAYRRPFFGRDGRFATGSLIFDLHRHLRRKMGRSSTEPHKTRLFPDI
jgi:hypothetical protein